MILLPSNPVISSSLCAGWSLSSLCPNAVTFVLVTKGAFFLPRPTAPNDTLNGAAVPLDPDPDSGVSSDDIMNGWDEKGNWRKGVACNDMV